MDWLVVGPEFDCKISFCLELFWEIFSPPSLILSRFIGFYPIFGGYMFLSRLILSELTNFLSLLDERSIFGGWLVDSLVLEPF